MSSFKKAELYKLAQSFKHIHGENAKKYTKAQLIDLLLRHKNEIQEEIKREIGADEFAALGGSFFSSLRDLKDRVKGAIFGNTELPNKLKELLNKYGNYTVARVVICREPIVSAVKTALDVLSLGKLNGTLKEKKYDEIYHLFALLNLYPPDPRKDSPITLRIEKNERIDVEIVKYQTKGQYKFYDPRIKLTFAELVDRALKKDGKNLIVYTATKWNCQQFLLTLFDPLNLPPPIKDFIYQDPLHIFSALPGPLKQTADVLTGLAARLRTVLFGAGII